MESNGFLNWLVKTMLSWARWLTDALWRSVNASGQGGGFYGWFSDNWTGLAVTLIVVGILIDWLIWMVRWRPYWLWFRKKQIIYSDSDEGRLAKREAHVDDPFADPVPEVDIFQTKRDADEEFWAEPDPSTVAPVREETVRPSRPRDMARRFSEPSGRPAEADVERADRLEQSSRKRLRVLFEAEEPKDDYEDPFSDIRPGQTRREGRSS